MDKTSLFCCLLSGLMALSVSATSPVATQAEVSGDISLRGIARLLQKSDIVLAVVIYKTGGNYPGDDILRPRHSVPPGQTFL